MYFIEHGFTGPQIASMLRVYLSTVRRRLSEIGLSIRQTYASITNNDLISLILANTYFPYGRYRFVDGWLRQKGFRVQETREALRQVDPVRCANRWLNSILRRSYYVAGPQALWHLDGNHKLIR